ncbi:hypothetical protein [Bacteroides heparinolyticus]|uniref:hypothetical protein n=1 Tax=Prevotella heparinolytica TaxID=28113 RepID=UPI0035A09A7A
MRNYYLSIVLLTLCLAGCRGISDTTDRQVAGMTAREIIEKNVFIDLSDEDLNPRTRSGSAPLAANPAFRAAVYRFYKKVTIDENNIAACHAKNAAELNMSEAMFNNCLNEMENLNEMIRNDMAKGIKGKRPPLNDDYFNRLLDESMYENAAFKRFTK